MLIINDLHGVPVSVLLRLRLGLNGGLLARAADLDDGRQRAFGAGRLDCVLQRLFGDGVHVAR